MEKKKRGRKKLTEEQKILSQQKRAEYLKKWKKEHGMDYYYAHKKEILSERRKVKEQKKGSPIRSWHKINLKQMSVDERNKYNRESNRKSRNRKKFNLLLNDLLAIDKVTKVECDDVALNDGVLILLVHFDYPPNANVETREWLLERFKLLHNILLALERKRVKIELEELEDNDTYLYIVSYDFPFKV